MIELKDLLIKSNVSQEKIDSNQYIQEYLINNNETIPSQNYVDQLISVKSKREITRLVRDNGIPIDEITLEIAELIRIEDLYCDNDDENFEILQKIYSLNPKLLENIYIPNHISSSMGNLYIENNKIINWYGFSEENDVILLKGEGGRSYMDKNYIDLTNWTDFSLFDDNYFRPYLIDSLKFSVYDEQDDKLKVTMSLINKYGLSFIDEIATCDTSAYMLVDLFMFTNYLDDSGSTYRSLQYNHDIRTHVFKSKYFIDQSFKIGGQAISYLSFDIIKEYIKEPEYLRLFKMYLRGYGDTDINMTDKVYNEYLINKEFSIFPNILSFDDLKARFELTGNVDVDALAYIENIEDVKDELLDFIIENVNIEEFEKYLEDFSGYGSSKFISNYSSEEDMIKLTQFTLACIPHWY